MKNFLFTFLTGTIMSFGQVGINTNSPDASSALEIESTTGGILIPRLLQTERDAILAPATGLMIYQTDATAGFYFWDGAAWTKIDGIAGPQGETGATGSTGNAGADGTNGTNGAQGIQGEAGADGIDGVGIAQTITRSGDIINLSDGGGTVNVNDTDSDLTNELQNVEQVLVVGNDANSNDIVNIGKIGIGIGTPHDSAALDITSTTGGLLSPRMITAQRDAISSAAKGLIVFNTTLNMLQINEGDSTTANWVSLSSAATSPTYSIGDVVNGGVVFYIFQSVDTGYVEGETHGLVCAFSDYQNWNNGVPWGCDGTDLPNVPNVPYNGGNPIGLGAEIGDGVSNTNAILNDCSTASAALAARSLGAQWFLPSAKELNQIYVNQTTLESVPGFSVFSSFYWSSTEIDTSSAWGQYFWVFNVVNNNKNDSRPVRAVRAF